MYIYDAADEHETICLTNHCSHIQQHMSAAALKVLTDDETVAGGTALLVIKMASAECVACCRCSSC